MKKQIGALVAAAGLCFSVLLGAPAALASDASLDERVEQVLRDFPGGVRISENAVAWEDGDIVLTLPTPGARFAVGSCETGKFCAYGGANLSGGKLTFSACKASNSTAPLGTVRSFANARSSGTVYAYNGATSVDWVGAGSWDNTSATITRLGC